MKKYLLIFLFANTTFALKNSSYIEIGGAGYLMTLNYERMLTEKIITRVGYGSHESDKKINFFPIGIAYLADFRKSNNRNRWRYDFSKWYFTSERREFRT